jgi:tetratricopeptide (TPR) repeat protein
MKKIIIYIIALLVVFNASGQESWPSPEAQQMYNQAKNYLSMGQFQQAIATYQQAIQLAPAKMVLYRDLGKAYFLTSNYSDAEKILEPVLKSDEADAQSYQIMASCYAASGEKRKARNTLQSGIERFPSSGLLYHDMGKMYEEENSLVYALEFWLDGIQHDPAYHINYYEAARMYMLTNKPVWAILYAETFLNIERHTQRADDTRKMLLDAYTRFFYDVPTGDVPKFGEAKKQQVAATASFEEAVKQTMMREAPAIRDGITPETLTMLRTRFLMDWFAKYAGRYPYKLFSYEDQLTRNGFFDIYNESLFGKAANPQEFDAWNKFHQGAGAQLEKWVSDNPLHPANTDFYNDKKVDEIFDKKKN